MLGVCGVFFDLQAEAADIDVHHLQIPLIFLAPHRGEDAVPGECFPGILQKILHDEIFHLGQLDLFSLLFQLTGAKIELIISRDQAVALKAPAAHPAVQRVHPRHQLGHGKGLGHIVVGAGHQSGDPVALLPHGSEHDDAHLAAHAPDAAAHVKAADVGKHHVQHGDGNVLMVPQIRGRLLAHGEFHRFVSGAPQIDHHESADIVLILQNQYFFVHLNIPPCANCSRWDGRLPPPSPPSVGNCCFPHFPEGCRNRCRWRCPPGYGTCGPGLPRSPGWRC